ncbi:SWI/SNF-related matrix-associated actin-dependent regulator of chromatin subfamily A-like protein 1 [Uranotaenia lowii]|uniref:SWI/SNF-related matrix-associated actin-dependent regulator of chromatin subfamily A-like protein 1 n=1 Tax=Uranotaenia lowii TaxID=190385 RepID=UPI002478E855|nr:SWI/SNF-related matrix-associated actin-dependent regulator of chromatin subfamily A-like protein 1 [Uranotaenia lowii]
MSCTAEEIAEKRRIAIERLNARKNALNNNNNSSSTNKPTFSLPPKQQAAVVHSTASFYGNSSKAPDAQQKPNFKQIVTNGTTVPKIKSTFHQARTQAAPYQYNGKSQQQQGTPGKLAPVFVKTVSCTCELISETRFVVTPNGFSEKIIEVFKSIPSKQYDPTSKLWTFSIKDYTLVQERINSLKPNATIGPIPSFVLNLFNGNPRPRPSRAPLDCIEPTLVESLLEFQKEGVCFAIDKGGHALIADEMGLGKTYQAIAVADFYKENWPLLVCTTATTRDTWAAKIRQLLKYVPVHNIVTLQSGQDYIGDARILITSYSLMEKCAKKLLEHGFGFVILDESHTLKNFKAKCTNVALDIAEKAKRVILLSGTPALSRPAELFTQLQMLDKQFFHFKEYSTRYCAGKQTNFGWDSTGQSNLNELNLLLAAKFMIRRTKQDVLSQLAEKSRETVVLDSSLLNMNPETEENLSTYAADYSRSKGLAREEILFKYYNVTAEAKAPAVCAYVSQILKEGQKFLIFAHHIKMLDSICQQLRKKKVDHIRIDGTTRSDHRTQYVDRFQTTDSCRAAVLSLKACNAGITLTAAQLVVFAELDWNPSTLAQAESRAHRIGQEGAVIVRYLLAKGTADDVIWTMLQKKQNILNKAGLCNENFSDSTCVDAPCSAGNIEPYLTKQPSSGTLDSFVLNVAVTEKKAEKTTEETDSFQNMLDDGEDDDLAGLNF